jgi:preprotein translocase subunit YajC
VIKNKLLSLGTLGIMLVGLLLSTSCLSGTTSAEGTASGGFDWTIIIFLVVIFGLMYLLMIRPQRKRQKEQQKMMSELQKGDEVITSSGIYGRIESVEENSFVIKIESGATMRVVRSAVAGKKPEN